MAGHRIDTEQVRRLHHICAAIKVRETRALPQIAAIQQDGLSIRHSVPQHFYQRP